MRIGFDIRPFLSGETGVGIYFRNLLEAMSGMEREDTFFLLSSSFKERFPKDKLPAFKNVLFRDLRIPVSLLNYIWFKTGFPPMGCFFGKTLDLTHSPNPVITPGGKKKIITVHDLSFIDVPDLSSKESLKYYAKGIEHSLKKADAVITVSRFTRSRIGEIFGKDMEDKTAVIYHGTDITDIEETCPAFQLPEKYFLFTGTIEPRKNLGTLLKAFSLAGKKLEGYKIILAGGKSSRSSEITRLISLLRLDDRVLLPGYITRGELKYLYKRAEALVFPSHYEGFGLPVLEAAASGIPSIVSDLEVFREIFENYPDYFDRDDPESLADAMIRMTTDSGHSGDRKDQAIGTAKRFSWRKAAEETFALYDRTVT